MERNGRIPCPDASGTAAAVWADCLPKFRPQWRPGGGSIALQEKATALQNDLLALVERDAQVFEPLSKAYGMPKATEEEKAEKARVMAVVLKEACQVPFEIMEKCCQAIDLMDGFAKMGSAIALSDAGVGVAFCKAALLGASLNVFINTKSMADRAYAEEIDRTASGTDDCREKRGQDGGVPALV